MSNREPGQPAIYVDNNVAFNEFCQRLSGLPLLGFDSEFIRTNTYFPRPGLLQLDDGNQSYLVDPLAIDQWDAFKQLLADSSTTVIIHSCSEDLGLLQYFLGRLPMRLFDTQRAAAFAGYGYSLSYQALVKAEFDIEIPKGETRSDWLHRPLSGTQIEYATLDVHYLIELQRVLTARLQERDMLAWFEQDCRDLLDGVPDEYATTPWESAYQSIGQAWQLDEPALRLLQKLAYWREEQARERNRPRNWIVRDPELLTLASRLSRQQTLDEVAIRRSNVFPTRFVDREARQLARFLNREQSFREPARPELLSKPLTGAGKKQLKALQLLTRELAEQLDISPELLARKRLWLELLENVQHGQPDPWPAGLNNWRRDLLEPEAMKILNGDSRD